MMKNRIENLCIAAAVTIFLVMSSCFCTFAAVPDLQRKCSVTFSMVYNGEPVKGGNLKMYRIATWTVRNGAYDFKWTYELADAGLNLADKDSEVFARHVSMLIESRSLPAIERRIDKDGKASFSDLDCGLYVVYQTEAAQGFETINAFCMALPLLSDGNLLYDVQASPKPRPEKNSGVTEPDKTNTLYTTTTVPHDNQEQERLPQTGQLWWPAWMLGAVGVILFGIGIVLRIQSRETAEEQET